MTVHYFLDEIQADVYAVAEDSALAIGDVEIGNQLTWVGQLVKTWRPEDGPRSLAGVALSRPDGSGQVRFAATPYVTRRLK